MPNNLVPLDTVFAALADPTRRAVVERLSRAPCAVSDLARPFDMTLPSFVQHLRVLEACGLVRSKKTGRVRICRLDPHGLGRIAGWIEARKAAWAADLDRLEAALAAGRPQGEDR